MLTLRHDLIDVSQRLLHGVHVADVDFAVLALVPDTFRERSQFVHNLKRRLEYAKVRAYTAYILGLQPKMTGLQPTSTREATRVVPLLAMNLFQRL